MVPSINVFNLNDIIIDKYNAGLADTQEVGADRRTGGKDTPDGIIRIIPGMDL